MRYTDEVFDDVKVELYEAEASFPPMTSQHEAYAIIKEELDEFWDECKRQPVDRKPDAMYHELKQVAAMAIRAMLDVC